MSAHGLFTGVTPNTLPYVFPGTIYIIFGAEGFTPGDHVFEVRTGPHMTMEVNRQTFTAQQGAVLAALPVTRCAVDAYGTLSFQLLADEVPFADGSLTVANPNPTVEPKNV